MRVSEALASLSSFFKKKGIKTPNVDAEWLLAFVLKCNRIDLYAIHYDFILSKAQIEQLRKLSIRRGRREPLQYILGHVDFYGQKLIVDERVLIPRPETEELIYQLQQYWRDKFPTKGLDLGTGSGAIAIALASLYPQLQMTAIDSSIPSLDLAMENAVANRVDKQIKFVHSSWFQKIHETFDFIVANPPYLTQKEVEEAAPEVRLFEPMHALVSAENGLADLKHIIKEAHAFLKPKGLLVLETGLSQHSELTHWAQKFGFVQTKTTLDLSHRERYFWCWRD